MMEDILAARVKELVEENERLKEKNEVYIETILQLKEEKKAAAGARCTLNISNVKKRVVGI